MAANDQRVRRRRRALRGQAMVEYSVVAHFILFSGTVMLLPIITTLFEYLSLFYDGVYHIIQTAAL